MKQAGMQASEGGSDGGCAKLGYELQELVNLYQLSFCFYYPFCGLSNRLVCDMGFKVQLNLVITSHEGIVFHKNSLSCFRDQFGSPMERMILKINQYYNLYNDHNYNLTTTMIMNKFTI